MKKTKKIRKSDFGYIAYKRKIILLQSVILYGISLSILIAGYFYHGRSLRNVLTILAVLGFLPASKSLVSAIMFWRAKGCSAGLRDRIMESGENFHHYYDFYFTSYEKNYPVSHMMLMNQLLIGITEAAQLDCGDCEKHLSTHLKLQDLKEIEVKIFQDPEAYCERIAELHYQYDPQNDTANSPDREAIIINVMKAISL